MNGGGGRVALTTLGVNGVCLYDGSWSEWGARSDLPIEPALPLRKHGVTAGLPFRGH
ncbi:thiosulfate sulfurtransferase, rhodanese [Klebsiella pneumoniae]|nr:thiosulfate sulfurtransferase, rhodanese [Klebsiella pneumoniae]